MILNVVGTHPKYIVVAFMLVTGFLSGWMSNTATTMLMLPIAAAVISQLQSDKDRGRFGLCLMPSLAYSASIGGMATLIGAPPNAIFFSSGYVTMPKMVRAGLPLDIIGIFTITALTAVIVPLVWS